MPVGLSAFSFDVGDASTGEKEVILVGHRKGVEGVVGHTGHVLALAISSDGKFVVSFQDCFCEVSNSSVLTGWQVL